MKKENEEDKIASNYPAWKKEVEIHRDYVGWKIYYYKKRYKHSYRDKLIRKFKQSLRAWDCEERDNELTLNDPDYPDFPITIKIGNFVTLSQNEFSVEIQSQSFDWKRKQMRDHGYVCQRILWMLPRGKKELYRWTKQGLVPIPVRDMKYYSAVLFGEDYWV